MTMRLIPLGTNGFYPSYARQTMSVLVLTDRCALLLDAGTGVARLSERHIKEAVRSYGRLNVILSHYHLDHVVGLSYLPDVWGHGMVRIFGPGRPFVETEPQEAIGSLLHPPLYPVTLSEISIPIEVLPVVSSTIDVDGIEIRVWPQTHTGGSVGIRVGDSIAYVTDTIADGANSTFVRGTRLLLHEVWLTDAEAERDAIERSRHSYVSAVAKFVRDSGVDCIMPVHHNPRRSDADLRGIARRIRDLSGILTVVPEEGRTYGDDGAIA